MAVSTVRQMASNPAAAARSNRARMRSRSRQAYTWNHNRAPGPATAAHSSIDRVPMVERVNGMPARPAARTTASSPAGSAMRVNPVGASTKGKASGRPSNVVEVSNSSRPCSTRGRNVVSRKAWTLRSSVSSSSAPPSM